MAIAPLYPLIVTNIIMINNVITSLASLMLKRHLQSDRDSTKPSETLE